MGILVSSNAEAVNLASDFDAIVGFAHVTPRKVAHHAAVPGSLFVEDMASSVGLLANAVDQSAFKSKVAIIQDILTFARRTLEAGGDVCLSLPSTSPDWLSPMVTKLIHDYDLATATVSVENNKGKPEARRYVCNGSRTASNLQALGNMKHNDGEPISHNKRRVFRTILASKFGFHSNAPSMPCVPVSTQECHREKHGTCGAALVQRWSPDCSTGASGATILAQPRQ